MSEPGPGTAGVKQPEDERLPQGTDECGICKTLTFHAFVTIVTLSNRISIETVSRMLGHRNLKTTQHYAKILDQKVSNDMQQLRDRLKRKA
ncbi:hypothetical protein Q4E40_07985 [Pontibacter sp. BT731]|uniref:hypothetical protein n=1 Tax=Pontibacter coccineus TaxID=3063328 RepID=UPI0026E1A9A5|nr:hypothetical protein [Pontibacter sp. BT731]MDO6390060.1 hypothetical protein [Pontibacter sp. BT731]